LDIPKLRFGSEAGEPPLAPCVSDDEEFELWDRIVDGLKVDVDRIEFEEAKLYVEECLSIECLNNIAWPKGH
jgi:hypothetical protein